MLKVVIAAAAALVVSTLAFAQTKITPMTGDYSLGSMQAPVVVTEYASPTCPACKLWHDTTFNELKTRFIDTGAVRFILKETPSHNKPVDAAIFAIARCAGREKYFEVVALAYARQQEIAKATASSTGARPELERLARDVGVPEAEFEPCVNSEDAANHLAVTREASRALGVKVTPTFAINGKLMPTVESGVTAFFLAQVEQALQKTSLAIPID